MADLIIIAYDSEATADWSFMLNLQAGRISVYREKRFDFVDWINQLTNFTTPDPATRRVIELHPSL